MVAILVDGAQIFSSFDGRRYRGWHPALILDPDDAPLLPATPSRRVGLYPRASLYAAEGCVTAVILAAGDRIAWTDIRDHYGYHEPAPARDPVIGDGQVLPIPDLAFDAAQYRAEITRATASRTWETHALATARLLRKHLREAAGRLTAQGWTPEFTEGRSEGYWVAFRDPGDTQLIVALPAPPGTAEQQAATMADILLTTPPQHWPVVHCSTCGHDDRQALNSPATRDTSAARRHPPHTYRPATGQ